MIDCKKLAIFAKLLAPATYEEIRIVQNNLNLIFPKDYIDFLRCSNGLRLKLHTNVQLYSTSDLEERNSTYEVALYAPDLLLIGDNGGGKGLFIKYKLENNAVYLIDLGSLVIEDAITLASNLLEWIDKGLITEEPNQPTYPKLVDVYLVRSPSSGNKGLLHIKQTLELSDSLGQIYKGAKTMPYRLLRSAPFVKYAKLCAKYNKLDDCLRLFEIDQPNKPIPIPSNLI